MLWTIVVFYIKVVLCLTYLLKGARSNPHLEDTLLKLRDLWDAISQVYRDRHLLLSNTEDY